MATASLVWLGYQFWRLLFGAEPIWPSSPIGAVDLKLLHRLVHDWFAGRPVYRELSSAVHPPATYVLLWPLLGWLEVTPARWLWAVTTLGALAWLVHIIVRESGAASPLERGLVALIPCSMYATGAAIGNGQLIVHLLPIMLAGLLVLRRPPAGWRAHAVAAGLVLVTLVKPSVSVPFLWLVLFVPRSPIPISLVSLGYGALTLLGLSFQETPPGALLQEWHSRSSTLAVTSGHGNVANLHVWLGGLGLEAWTFPASAALLLALGWWSYQHRRADIWIQLGVTAYVARVWTYHRWYDDALILLPMVALYRIARGAAPIRDDDVIAGVLLALTLVLMLAPGGLFLLPPPWNTAYVVAQTSVWLVSLVFLLRHPRVSASPRTGPIGG